MEKPGIEPATPGLQGIALIHYTTAASFGTHGLGPTIHYTAAATLKHLTDKCVLYRPNNYNFSNIYGLTEITPFFLISLKFLFFSYR